MSEITDAWEKVKNKYIARYYEHYTKYLENPNDLVNKGAMLENCLMSLATLRSTYWKLKDMDFQRSS